MEVFIIANLSNRIKSLRLSANLTQEEFGKKFGIVKSTVSLYESGKSTPNDQIKKQICDYFSVSLDYLLGNSDVKQINSSDSRDFFFSFFFKSWSECKKRICSRMQELSISETDFINETNIDLEKEINIDDLITIAKRLNISIDYLLGISNVKNIILEDSSSLQNITERERNIIDTYRELDEDNKDIIVGEMKKILKEQRYQSVVEDELLKRTGTDCLGK